MVIRMSEMTREEEKEAEVEKRMEAAKQRNLAIERRHAEIEEEKRILGVAAQAPKLVLDDAKAGNTGSHWTAPKFKDEWVTRDNEVEFEGRIRNNQRFSPDGSSRSHNTSHQGNTEGQRGQTEGHRGDWGYGGHPEGQSGYREGGHRSTTYGGYTESNRSHGSQQKDQPSRQHHGFNDGNDKSHRNERPQVHGSGCEGDLRNTIGHHSNQTQSQRQDFGSNPSRSQALGDKEENWGQDDVKVTQIAPKTVNTTPSAPLGTGVMMKGVANIRGSTPGSRGRGRGRGKSPTPERPIVTQPSSSLVQEEGRSRPTRPDRLVGATQSLSIQQGSTEEVIDLTRTSPSPTNSTLNMGVSDSKYTHPVETITPKSDNITSHYDDKSTSHYVENTEYDVEDTSDIDVVEVILIDDDDMTPVPSRESTPARRDFSKESTPVPEGTNRIGDKTKPANKNRDDHQSPNHARVAENPSNQQPDEKVPVSSALHIDIRDPIQPTVFSPTEDDRPDYLRTPDGGWSNDWATVVESLEGN